MRDLWWAVDERSRAERGTGGRRAREEEVPSAWEGLYEPRLREEQRPQAEAASQRLARLFVPVFLGLGLGLHCASGTWDPTRCRTKPEEFEVSQARCVACGRDVPEDAGFCPCCGTPVPQPSSSEVPSPLPPIDPRDGAILPLGGRFGHKSTLSALIEGAVLAAIPIGLGQPYLYPRILSYTALTAAVVWSLLRVRRINLSTLWALAGLLLVATGVDQAIYRSHYRSSDLPPLGLGPFVRGVGRHVR